MRERVAGGGARAALGTCVRERRPAAQHGAFGPQQVPGERRSTLRGRVRGGGILGIFESRWHLSHSQRGRCVTWGRRRAAGGDTDLRWGQAPSHVLCMLRACVWGLSCAGAPRGRRRRMSSNAVATVFDSPTPRGRDDVNAIDSGPDRRTIFPDHAAIGLRSSRCISRGGNGGTMRTCFRCCMYMHMCTRRRSQTPLHSHTPRVQLYTQISPITE